MRPYWAVLSARFRMLLQYRAAALAGLGTQVFWGLIRNKAENQAPDLVAAATARVAETWSILDRFSKYFRTESRNVIPVSSH